MAMRTVAWANAHCGDGEPPSEELFLDTLAEAVGAIEAASIRYLLMGGVSAATLSRPRATDDIDLFVAPEDARPALVALEGAGFTVEETFPTWLFKGFKHGVLVDVIFRSSGDIYLDDEMLERSRAGEYKGRTARLISPDDLLVIKAVATAEHGPHHWYDALGIIARNDLDWAYVVRRARQAGPRRVLSLLLYAESNDLAVPAEAIESLFAAVHPMRGEPT